MIYCAQCDKTFHFFSIKCGSSCPTCKSVLTYKCGKCSKVFTHRSSFPKHVKNCGMPKVLEKKFFCPHCDFGTHVERNLTIHIQARHMPRDQIWFHCTKCLKNFSRQYALTRHSKICCTVPSRSTKPADSKDLFCAHCAYSTQRKFNLASHIQAKHSSRDSNAYKCTKCQKIYSNPSSLYRHVKICYGPKENVENLFFCPLCNYKSPSRINFKRHQKNIHSNKLKDLGTNSCNRCKKIYKTQFGLKNHLITCESSSLGYLYCDHCDYKSLRKAHLISHIQSKHFPPDPIKCTKCEKSFSTRICLNKHLKLCGLSEDAKNSVRRFTCDYCQHKTYDKYQILIHIRVNHLPRDPNSYKCKNCEKSFISRSGLWQHSKKVCGQMKSHHNDYKTTRKEQLGKLKSTIKLDRHNRNKRVFEYLYCDHCKYKTLEKQFLVYHMQSKHMSVNTFKCPTCKKSFSTPHYLRAHTRHSCKNSSRLRRLTCDICQYTTSFKRLLVSHIQRHMGLRFKCKACGNSLKSKMSYITHVNYACKHSSKLKRFSCDHCQYKATKKNNLLVHIQTNHLNENSTCNVCKKSYSTQSGFNRHLKYNCKKRQ